MSRLILGLALAHSALAAAVGLGMLRLLPVLGVATLVWAALHGVVALSALGVALVRRTTLGALLHSRPRALELVGALGLAWCFVITEQGLRTALGLVAIHGPLGRYLNGAGWALLGLIVALSLPYALLCLRAARRTLGAQKRIPIWLAAGLGLGAVSLLLALDVWRARQLGGEAIRALQGVDIAGLVSRVELRGKPRSFVPWSVEPVACAKPVASDRVTLFVHYVARKGRRGQSRCVQASSLERALATVSAELDRRAANEPFQIDVATRIAPLDVDTPLSRVFALRGASDGVCAGTTCLSAFALVARGLVRELAPIPALPELRGGVAPGKLRSALGLPKESAAEIFRVELESSYFGDQVIQLDRQRPKQVALSSDRLSRALAAVEDHVKKAQLPSGAFRYGLSPITGKVARGDSLARQAGTLLVLCELGVSVPAASIRIGMHALLEHEVVSGDGSVLALPREKQGELGTVALPLAALLRCAARLPESEPRLDAAIVRLSRTLLLLQRPSGGFFPSWDIEAKRPIDGPEAVFAPGQAVLALVELEARIHKRPERSFPALETVRQATERAMQYYAGPYRAGPFDRLTQLEENWHCLAAREALSSHRNAAYESFCLEYADYKGRFVLGAEAPPILVGAYAFSPLMPPPNTATAGVGEMLAAAIEIRRARGESFALEADRLRRVLGFLLRQQWDETACAVCDRPELVLGGFSDSIVRPDFRIDFAQHAWAALGHGGRSLGLFGDRDR